jgi:GxxExxY protein
MDTNNEKLLAKEEVFQIVGCAVEVLNALGHGLLEKAYENALTVEFRLQSIPASGSNRRLISYTKDIRSVCSFPI